MTPASPPSNPSPRSSGGFFTDVRFLRILAQAALIAFLGVILWYIGGNIATNLASSRIPFGFRFWDLTAGFSISEGPPFSPQESFGRAFIIGVINTLRVVIIGNVLATILGLLVGIARLSNNWLIKTIAGWYVEILRNIPLLVQLFFWYTAVVLRLPPIDRALQAGDLAWLSNRGLAMAWLYPSQIAGRWMVWLAVGVILAVLVWLRFERQQRKTDEKRTRWYWVLLAFLIPAVGGYLFVASTSTLPAGITYNIQRGDRGTLYVEMNNNTRFDPGIDQPMVYVPITLYSASGEVLAQELTADDGTFRFFGLPEEGKSLTWETPAPLVYSEPILQGFNVRGGRTFTPEFTALLLGLVIYTSAFIAEIVRAGITAVSKGQWEASRALGLGTRKTMSLIVLPQALRVIIPPLTNQYLNLTKNSSLAIAVGYPDLFNISLTIMNQAGATVQMFLIIMVTYLSFSLITSAIMNWYNKRVALVER